MTVPENDISIYGHMVHELITEIEWANQNAWNPIFKIENLITLNSHRDEVDCFSIKHWWLFKKRKTETLFMKLFPFYSKKPARKQTDR